MSDGNNRQNTFIVSPYLLDDKGSFSPILPTACPLYAADPDVCVCKIGISHLRDRKTGPQFPLFVMVCKEHHIGFTLYPPGCYPYGRHALAPVAPDGSQLIDQSDCNSFTGTIFDAALDAKGGIVWDRESVTGSHTPRFITQGRHIERIAQLLGIGSGQDFVQREETAQILMVPGQLLHDCATKFNDTPNIPIVIYKGTIISNIIEEIPISATIFERLAEIGAGAELWPAPFFCNPAKNVQRSPFSSIRTRGSP